MSGHRSYHASFSDKATFGLALNSKMCITMIVTALDVLEKYMLCTNFDLFNLK